MYPGRYDPASAQHNKQETMTQDEQNPSQEGPNDADGSQQPDGPIMSPYGYVRPTPPPPPPPQPEWDSLDGLPADAQQTGKFKKQWHKTAQTPEGREVKDIEGEPTQCRAFVSATGERCRHKAIVGGTVCPKHGGSQKAVKQKAALRLAEMVNPALFVLGKIMLDEDAKHSDRLRAVENVLDRSGHGRSVISMPEEDAKALLAQKLMDAIPQDPDDMDSDEL